MSLRSRRDVAHDIERAEAFLRRGKTLVTYDLRSQDLGYSKRLGSRWAPSPKMGPTGKDAANHGRTSPGNHDGKHGIAVS